MTKPQKPAATTTGNKKNANHDVVEYTSFGKVNLSQNARDLASMVTPMTDPKKKSKKP
jgi:hypothetical protein